MPNLLSLLILVVSAAAPPTAADGRYPDAVEVFHCDFGAQWDQDFDHWPDGWTRLRSAAFPSYVPARICDDAQIDDGRTLRIDMDGGAAAVYSPQIKVNAIFSYVVETRIKTEKLFHDEAYLSITFYDAKHKPLEQYTSEHISGSIGWRRLRIDPIAPARDGVDHAVVGLHVQPSNQADIQGAAAFADVWVGRLPRMTFKTDRRDNVYVDPARPKLTCTASGFDAESSRVVFQIIDSAGNVVQRHEQQLNIVPQTTVGPGKPAAGEGHSKVIVGSASYSPPIAGVGFYRARVAMLGRAGLVHQRELSLAIVRPEPNPQSGEFGWTLPGGDNPLSMAELTELLSQSGVNWVKFPVWSGGPEGGRGDRLVWFAERLRLQHIEMVGLLNQPPAELLKKLGESDRLLAAQIFSTEPELWYPSLEPVLTSLSLKVKWWELGVDKDTSFVGYPKTAEKINQFRRYASRFGQQVNIGIGWSWLNELPKQPQAWDAVSLSTDPPLTWEEQAAYLAATHDVKTRRWVVLEPLSRSEYALEARASDLARRMLAAKMGGADAIFVPEVFSAERGLMNEDGTAGDLLLPWRTTALALGGAQYLGSVDLPNKSVNRIFQRDGRVVMVLWSDRPTTERLYLGDDVSQMDLWGRPTKLDIDRAEQVIHVGSLPTFITGLNAPVLRWRMSAALAETQWPSVFGVTRGNALVMKNTFGQGISGKIRMILPDGWKTADRDINFKLASGETLEQPFQVQVPLDAATGKQEIRFEFDIMADRRYQFALRREIDLGLDDVYASVSTRLNEQGELEIEQRLTNDTDKPVSFKCFLYAPDRLPVVTQVVELGRGTDTKTYRLANGAALIGKNLLLRADEIAGQRIINYRFTPQQ